MKTVLYGRYSKGSEKTVTTTPPALAVNTYPANAKSFELQGRSLALNQQIYQIYNTIDPSLTGLTVTFNNGMLSVSGTADVTLSIQLLDNNDLVANHIYYFNSPAGSSTSGYRPYFATSGDNYTTDSIITWTTGKGSFNIRVNGGTSTDFSYYPQFIDLTQMFGAGFEPTTVDQLKAIIDLDKYISHNPGTFIHNNATYEVNKWNQILSKTRYNPTTASSGITCTNNNDGTFTVTGTSTASISYTYMFASTSNPIVLDPAHKYIVPVSDEAVEYTRLTLTTSSDTTGYSRCNVIITGYKALVQIWNRVAQDVTVNYTTSFSVIDLTDIFGAGKEPSTVDECKLRFLSMGIDITKYQPYSPLGGQYCGYRNIWDEEWELGDFNATTGAKESGSRIINTNYIPVLSNTNYYVNNTNVITVYYYDSNKTFLGYNNPSSGCFESLPNSAYINFRCSTTYGTTYKNDISIYQISNKVDLGFNIWDEEWEVLYTNYVFSKHYIPVLPSTTYYFKDASVSTHTLYYYDSNKTQISNVNFAANNPFTTPAGCCFMKFSYQGTTYHNDICINLSQSDTTKSPHNGDYRPYLMLRGIGSDFNVWDEQIESGEYNATTGEKQAAVDYLRSVNKTRVLPSTTYYLKCPLAVSAYYYDANGVKIGTNSPTLSANSTFTTVAGAYYMTFAFNKNNYGSTTYKNNICINLSQPQTTINPHNGQYVPHLFDTYDSMSGILTRRIKQVTFTGSGDGAKVGSSMTAWEDTYGTTNSYGIRIFSLNYCDSKNGGAVLSGFGESYRDRNSQLSQEGMGVNTSANVIFIAILASRLSTVSSAGFATWLQSNPLTLLYELNAYQVFIPQTSNPYKFGVVDMGTLSWTRVDVTGSGGYVFSTPATPLQMYKQSDNLWCSGYTTGHYTGTGSTIYNYGNKTIAQHTPSGEFNIYVRDDSYTSASDFKNAVKGMILTYELSDSVSQTTITQPISFVSGKLGKQYGVVDLGSLNWTINNAHTSLYVGGSTLWGLSSLNLYTSKYVASSTNTSPGYMRVANGNLIIYEDKFDNATSFKNSLQGQYLIYKLADSATNPTYATAGNLIQKTKGDVGDVDFNLTYNTLLNENKFLISYNMGTSQSPDKRLINVGGILNA